MNVGRIAGLCQLFLVSGDEHMKPGGNDFTQSKFCNKTETNEASTNWRKDLFKVRTKPWNAAKSKSTSAFHISFFNLIGTSDMTRHKSILTLTFSLQFESG